MWGKPALGLNSTLTLIEAKPWFASLLCHKGEKCTFSGTSIKQHPELLLRLTLCLKSSTCALAATI